MTQTPSPTVAQLTEQLAVANAQLAEAKQLNDSYAIQIEAFTQAKITQALHPVAGPYTVLVPMEAVMLNTVGIALPQSHGQGGANATGHLTVMRDIVILTAQADKAENGTYQISANPPATRLS